MTKVVQIPTREAQALRAMLPPEATPRRAMEKAMARRRFQSPKPFKEGQFWWLRVWDTNLTGSRKRQRIKLAPAEMPVREVQKIAEEKLRPVNQGLVLTGSAMNFGDFVTSTYNPTYLPLLSSSTQDSYRGVISKYLEPEILAAVAARPHAAHDTAVFLRHGGHRCRIPQSRKSGTRCLPFSALRSMWTT